METVRRIMKMFSLGNLRLFGRDCSGATTIESTLLAALLAIAILSGVKEAGSLLFSVYDQTDTLVCDAFESVGGSGGGSGGPGGGSGAGYGCGVGGGGSGGGGSGLGGGSGGGGSGLGGGAGSGNGGGNQQ